MVRLLFANITNNIIHYIRKSLLFFVKITNIFHFTLSKTISRNHTNMTK